MHICRPTCLNRIVCVNQIGCKSSCMSISKCVPECLSVQLHHCQNLTAAGTSMPQLLSKWALNVLCTIHLCYATQGPATHRCRNTLWNAYLYQFWWDTIYYIYCTGCWTWSAQLLTKYILLHWHGAKHGAEHVLQLHCWCGIKLNSHHVATYVHAKLLCQDLTASKQPVSEAWRPFHLNFVCTEGSVASNILGSFSYGHTRGYGEQVWEPRKAMNGCTASLPRIPQLHAIPVDQLCICVWQATKQRPKMSQHAA